MNWIEKLIYLTSATMDTPGNFGPFHLICLAVCIAVTVLFCVFLPKASDRTFRRVVFVCWVLILLAEVYFHLLYSFEYTDGEVIWTFHWYKFPFQLCSTPMYVLPFVIFLRDGAARDAAIMYIMLFATFGGLCVYAFPNDVFIDLMGVNVQTMFSHGMQIVLGVSFAVRYRTAFRSMRRFFGGLVVFAILMSIALALNLIVPCFIDEVFNMFYIGPRYPCTLPLLSLLYPLMPPYVFILVYFAGFALVALLLFSIYKGIFCLADRRKKARA